MNQNENGLPDSQKGFEEALQLIEAFKEMAKKSLRISSANLQRTKPITIMFIMLLCITTKECLKRIPKIVAWI